MSRNRSAVQCTGVCSTLKKNSIDETAITSTGLHTRLLAAEQNIRSHHIKTRLHHTELRVAPVESQLRPPEKQNHAKQRTAHGQLKHANAADLSCKKRSVTIDG